MKWLTVAVWLWLAQPAFAQPDGRVQRAPFTDAEFLPDGSARVMVAGEWWEWLALDGIPYGRLQAAAATIGDWDKRLAEDLDAVLGVLGHRAGDQVTLEVRPIDGGPARTLGPVDMTRANRAIVLDRQNLRAMQPAVGTHADALRALAGLISERHAYASLRTTDPAELAEAEIAAWAGNDPSPEAFVLAAQRLVCRLGDGHARVREWDIAMRPGWTPCVFEDLDGRVVAIRPDRSGFAAAETPFVRSIDGVPVERWMEAASRYVAAGSEQLVRRRSARLLARVAFLRQELGLTAPGPIRLELENDAGRAAVLEVPVMDTAPRTRERIERPSGRLTPRVGYLRVRSMVFDEGGVEKIMADFWAMSDAPFVIVDVRGNGGGDRDLLPALAPALMPPGDHAVVFNAARVRLGALEPGERAAIPLADRMLFPGDWSGWTAVESEAIARFVAGFRPSFRVDDAAFSPWQYGVLSATPDVRRYAGRVVVLMDAECFSATDIFLAGISTLDAVRLAGEPSSGGSARSRRAEVPGTEMTVQLGSMVSYQPDGSLFDGVGVRPDLLLARTVEDCLAGVDTQLERLVEMLERDPAALFGEN